MRVSLGRRIYRTYGIYIIFGILFLLLSLFIPNFFTMGNMTNIMRNVSVYAILAFGMTFVMISGCIDLSVGSVLALSGCISAVAMQKGAPLWLAVALSLGTGCVCGLINGFCIAKLKVPFFITTAGMMYAAAGLALVITHESPINLPDSYQIFAGSYTIANIFPPQFLIAAGFFVVCLVILTQTKMGRYTFAIGSNERTALLSGVNVDLSRILVFVMSGFAAALAGVIVASRTQTGTPLVASNGYEIYAVAAAAIGGTSLAGGEGNLGKTVVGSFILTIIYVALQMTNTPTSVQKIIVGIIMVAVVAIDMWDRRKQV